MSNEDRFGELMRQLPPKMAEEQRTARAKAQAEETARLNKSASLFQLTDAVHGGMILQGNIDPDSVVTIRKWQNQKGDTVYLTHTHTQQTPDFSQDEMLALSTQIKTERADFEGLDPSEQAKIRKEGNTKFGAYLSNEALGEQFRKLK